MLRADQRHALLLADRSHDAGLIRETINRVLNDNASVTLLDCEMAFRDAAASTYLVAGEAGLMICGSMSDALAALRDAGSNPGQNWIALTERNRSREDGQWH